MSKTLTLGSLFDGSGGFPLAATLNGIDPIWASEIEPFPIRVTTKRFPNMKHYGDINKISGEGIEPVDIISFGSPCFSGDSLVTTSDGLKPIKDIKIGDMVLTHQNRYQKVIDHQLTEHNASVCKLTTMGGDIIATPNHKFYVRTMFREWDNEHRTYRRKFHSPIWKELQNIDKSDYVGTPINTLSENPYNLTEEECYLIGRYIADGYIINRKRSDRKNSYMHKIIWCIGKSKIDIFKKKLVTYKISINEDRTVYKCMLWNERMEELCLRCGRGAENKHFPPFLLNLPANLLRTAIEGYMDGDGYIKGSVYTASSISKLLIYTLSQAINKVYCRPCSIYYVKTPETTMIEGRTVHQHDYYALRFKLTSNKQDKAFCENNYIWMPIRKIETSENTDVYNITVEEDHSYCVQNIIVKNCQDLSLAGNRKGLVEGNQSNLFFQAIRLIKEMREATDGKYPRFIIWENVTGAFISNCGDDFYAVIKEICNIKENETNTKWDIPRPDKWTPSGAIVEDNFSLAWRTFDSQYWGVPQRRERIYLVADFGGKCAPKILFESESLSGYSNKGFKTWEDITKNIEEGIGTANSKPVLNNQGGSVKDITYDYVNTLRAESHNHSPIVLDYHPNDSRIDIKSDNTTIQTLTSRMETGGNNVPLVMQETYNICGKNSNSMKSDNPESGIYKSNISRTIDTSGLNPSCNRGGTVVIEGNGTRPSHLGNGYKESGVMYTLNTTEEHAVAYDVRFTLDNSQAERNRVYETNVSRTLDTTVSDPNSNHGGLAIIETEDDINYVVRKLTPTECAKLQGFPEWWCSNLDIKNPTEDDIAFWEDVFNTYNQAVNTTTKKSVKNIIKFLKHPHSDTAEYKMWGNGISLPIPYYIFFGIKYWSSVDSDDVKVNLVKESKLF